MESRIRNLRDRRHLMLKSIAGAVIGEVIGRKQGHGLLGAGIGLVATRIATRSIPGLLLVGGAIAAKTIYDKSKERKDA
jgi:uncharacterized protein (DUF697 family)